MPAPRVTFVCHNLSGNGVTRGLLLMKALEPHARISLAGLLPRGGALHNSLRGSEGRWPVHAVAAPTGLLARPALARLQQAVRESSPDVVVALKPRPASLGLAVQAMGPGRVIVDIDDDELAFHHQRPAWVRAYKTLLGWPNPFGVHRLVAMEDLARRVAARWCATSVLVQKFGGDLLPHPVDPAPWLAALSQRAAKRGGLAWDDNHTVVLFSGTLRKHKGFEVLVKAVEGCGRPGVVLALLGAAADDPALAPWRARLGPRFQPLGRVGAGEVPDFLAAADVVALPTLDRPAARAQLPIKLAEAMMSGRAVVASELGDAAALVKNAGLLIPPGDANALAQALAALADSPDLRTRLGTAARERAITHHDSHRLGDWMALSVARVMGEACNTQQGVDKHPAG